MSTRFVLGAVTAGGTSVLLIVPHGLVMMSRSSPIALHLIIAAVWSYWLGWLFPRRWQAHTEKHGRAQAYRAAFPTDIVFGICGNFSQMLRPAFYGILGAASVSPTAALGVLPILLGAAMIVMALRVIGIAGAMFVWEYKHVQPVLTTHGIYGTIRHPLFLGGVLVSVGLALMTGGGEALLMAAVNVAMVPVFLKAENRRSQIVFGEKFFRYRSLVPAIVPRISLPHRAT